MEDHLAQLSELRKTAQMLIFIKLSHIILYNIVQDKPFTPKVKAGTPFGGQTPK
jgi:hypothetical protein